MNISQPVSTSIEGVNFGFLSSQEIQSLSVKRITNPVTFDALLHPTPGGLYDPALGAVLDNPCSTCHLSIHACPGHCGHIELPVSVYHCVFMDQAYRLLRATCLYCGRFRLSREEINRYSCKLDLIRYGLLAEAEELEDIGMQPEEGDVDEEDTVEKRLSFVKRCIRKAGGAKKDFDSSLTQTEVVARARKAVLEKFHGDIVKTRKCLNCKGISPGYRKNRYTSIFRKPLNKKETATNVQNGIKKAQNPLIALNKAQKEKEHRIRKKKQKIAERRASAVEIDEGVADMDSSPGEEIDEAALLDGLSEEQQSESEEEEDEEEVAGDDTGATSVLQTEASMPKARKRRKADEEAQTYVNANEVHASLVHLFENESEILAHVYSSSVRGAVNGPSADMFFIQHLLVPPNKYRKEQKTGPDEISESPDNESYRKILAGCDELYQIRREVQGNGDVSRTRIRTYDDLQRSWLGLQDTVNSLIDSDKNPVRGLAGLRNPEGIKQKLEKKEGVFRMNIMGKRVNFAARSVISPDPNIETNEIGVPPVFAKRLTYPEPVTSHNFDELKQAVRNGAEKWPGAIAIEYENGQVINLRKKNDEERQAIANLLLAPSSTSMTGVRNKKVHRHLNNGDIVIMNRQPTLHKPSMMAHRAKVLPGEKTIRMHYANCNTYNADFDGDEMNMHFPQNEIARAEALQIADTDHQYLSATAGQPLRGLIQDHISMGVWLTSQDTFFTREEYQELLYSCLRPEHNHTSTDRILTVDPTIQKPKPRWTGKQVIDSVLLNIKPTDHAPLHLISRSQTPSDRWGPGSEEGDVRIMNGELVTGILDKKQIGPSSGGLVHTVYEAYGHTVAGKLLSILGRLLTKLLHMRAFSCGVEDLLLTEAGETNRRQKLAGSETIGLAVASKYVSLTDKEPKADNRELMNRLESVLRDEDKQAGLDTVMNGQTAGLSSEITRACLPDGLVKAFPKNQMQAMTTSGAKGTMVNANLISCNLGQQVLEGRRVPVMISGKTLPSFRPFESNIRAGGYIVDRFLTGVRPQEYFFHAMAGREGLIDTAVKTSRSGYLQRCLVKGLEGLRAEYDTTVRDADGTIIQTLYGEDGLDITKQQSLMDFKFLSKNFLSLFASLNVRDELKHTTSEEAVEWNKAAVKKTMKTGDDAAMDPAISRFAPGTYAGSTSEKFYLAAKQYIADNPDRSIRSKQNRDPTTVPKQVFMDLLHLNYLKAVIQPGEAIGVVAAQSIGEPSTQMTLNTFHLAGHATKNVTLGIPRLREILMTASRILKTPTMTLYPIPEVSEDEARTFSKAISRLSLAEVIDHISVEERIDKGMYPDSRIYEVRLALYPEKEYTKEYAITVDDVVQKIEKIFLPKLQGYIKSEFKRRGQEKSLKNVDDAHPAIGESAGRIREEAARPEGENEGGDSDEDDAGDDDATDAKKRANLNEGATYEDPDESDEEVEKQGQREASPEPLADSEDETYGSAGSNDDENEAGETSQRSKTATIKSRSQDREERIKSALAEVTSFSFDDKHGASCSVTFQYPATTAKLLILPLVNKSARNTLIQEVKNLASCTLLKDDNNKPIIFTEGVNLEAARQYQHIINPHRIFTNDVGAMLVHYGVEAARGTIIRELRAVFDSHGIKVDLRHLTLVADYMTRGGGFAAFSRTGMRDKRSPFAKMSFETTIGFLRDAVFDGDTEDLRSPSARITIGKVGRVGTGMCDVMMPVA